MKHEIALHKLDEHVKARNQIRAGTPGVLCFSFFSTSDVNQTRSSGKKEQVTCRGRNSFPNNSRRSRIRQRRPTAISRHSPVSLCTYAGRWRNLFPMIVSSGRLVPAPLSRALQLTREQGSSGVCRLLSNGRLQSQDGPLRLFAVFSLGCSERSHQKKSNEYLCAATTRSSREARWKVWRTSSWRDM